MAVGDFLTWAVQAQDAPAHVARILQTILLNEGVVDVAGDSFEVTEDTGSNMDINIGSGTLGDLAVIEGDDTAGQGTYVIEAQNATVTRTISASDPSDDRIDLVVLQNYDDEADSSGNNDAEVEVIEGTPAGSPSAPSLPDSAIPLAEVLVGNGVTAITDADITDLRENAKTGGAAPAGMLGFSTATANQTGITSEVALTDLSVDVTTPGGRLLKVSVHGRVQKDGAGRVVGDIQQDGSDVARWLDHALSNAETAAAAGFALVTPSEGSYTFRATLQNVSGTSVDSLASSDLPAAIVVEDLGPA